MGIGASFTGVKWPTRKVDHLPQPSAEIKNGGAIPPLPSAYSFHNYGEGHWTYKMIDATLGTVFEIPGHLVTKDIRKCGGINERVIE
jgi:hypothetical protein